MQAQVNLALAGTVLIVVLSAAVLQHPQASDAVRAHVPEYVASDFPQSPLPDALLSISHPEQVVDHFSHFRPHSGTAGMRQPFLPVSATLVGTEWRGR